MNICHRGSGTLELNLGRYSETLRSFITTSGVSKSVSPINNAEILSVCL
ncbi:hypothetical protein E2C01_100369 [Portunus trituberculatus]|uniref:Uncharacterized protein n=1 Tax=Portunus trituberculatus TaxID=210409 RepID=A0A5B7KC27_PORTR|nr:hypothetical protein [Portunus trituberculatus]